MTSQGRLGRFGGPTRNTSQRTEVHVFPTAGYTDAADVATAPSSIISGQNFRLWGATKETTRLVPRPRLQSIGNVLGDVPTGAFNYFDINGDGWPILFSKSTAAYFSAGTWVPLSYVASATSNNPPTGGQNDQIFGTSIYLPRADTNLAVWTNGVDPAFVWGGPPSGSTAYSTGTQAYIAKDVTVSNNRLVYWNVGYLSSTSRLVTRCAWSAAGNPEDTTGFDAGYIDLLDMTGVGTRIFRVGDQLIVATDQEIQRGTFIGPPFTYQFVPLARTQGIPFARAALNTPEGLYWLGSDDMIYNVPPYYWFAKIDAVGAKVQRTLSRQMADPTTAFFAYHPDAKHLTLYYTDTAGQAPNRAMTLNTLSGQWMPQLFTQRLVVGFQAPPVAVTSSATTWGGLTGSLASNVLTYNQLLGLPSEIGSSGFVEAVAASTGTAYVFQNADVQSTDDGQAVLSTAQFGPVFTGDMEHRKLADEVRLDVQCDTSNTSIAVTLQSLVTSAFSSQQIFQLSPTSTSSQYRAKVTPISDVYHTVIVSGLSGQYAVNQVYVQALLEGELL